MNVTDPKRSAKMKEWISNPTKERECQKAEGEAGQARPVRLHVEDAGDGHLREPKGV